jgi:hypothetical protein
MTREQIQGVVEAKGFKYFLDETNKGFDVNIVGVRNSAPGSKVTNLFDDTLTISYKENGIWQFKSWPCTTDPGVRAMKQFHNPNGVARLVPGQYRSSHMIGLHQGKYKALRQKGNVTVYRDADKDLEYDTNKEQTGVFGINIHHAGANSSLVENWSEGCQVFKKIADFNEFMKICTKASEIHGNSFTYTLIESKEIK